MAEEKEYTYQIEATYTIEREDFLTEETETITITLEHENILVALSHLEDRLYPAKLEELHCVRVLDEGEDEDKKGDD